MPTYTHSCTNTDCKNEWDDFYSISQDPPKVCPACNQETAKRVISSGGSKGVVELYGQDLKDKIQADTQKLKQEIHQDANKYANLLGEEKYHKLQTKMDRR
jgi:putative FmdB family regulatory protein